MNTSLPIQKYNASLEQASTLVKGLPREHYLSSCEADLPISWVGAMLQKMETLRGMGQTHNLARLKVKESSVAYQNLE